MMHTTTYAPIGRPLDMHAREWIHALVVRLGPVAAARQIGLSRGTLAAALAGLPIAGMTEARVLAAMHRRAA
jgi:hypothetical protein